MTKKKADEPRYAELSNELEQILDEIESGEIDLDELSPAGWGGLRQIV